MSNALIFRPKPKEFRAEPVDGLDLAFPVGVDTEMYSHVGDDEQGNHIFEQVGTITFLDKKDKTKFEVDYDPEYEGARDHESDASKTAREEFLAQKKAQEEADAKQAEEDAKAAAEAEKETTDEPDDSEVESGTDEGEVSSD